MKAVVKASILLGTAFLLSACATDGVVTTQQIERPKLFLPDVDRVKFSEVHWYTINKTAKPGDVGSTDDVFKKSNSQTLLAVTPRDYENLSLNNAQILRTVKQLQSQVKAYKQYYIKNDAVNENKNNKK